MKRKILVALICLVSLNSLACSLNRNTGGENVSIATDEAISEAEHDVETMKEEKRKKLIREKFFHNWFLPALKYNKKELEVILKDQEIEYEITEKGNYKIKDPNNYVDDIVLISYSNGKDGNPGSISYSYIDFNVSRTAVVMQTDGGTDYWIQKGGNKEPIDVETLSQVTDFLFDGIVPLEEAVFYDRYFDLLVGLSKDEIIVTLDDVRYTHIAESNQIHVYDDSSKDKIIVNLKEDKQTVDIVMYVRNSGEIDEKIVSCKYVGDEIKYSIQVSTNNLEFVDRLSARKFLFGK